MEVWKSGSLEDHTPLLPYIFWENLDCYTKEWDKHTEGSKTKMLRKRILIFFESLRPDPFLEVINLIFAYSFE